MSFPHLMITDLYGQPQHHRGTYMLVQDIPQGSSQRIGWTIRLMDIYEHERDVDRGRFAHFSREPQEWPASIRIKDDSGPLTEWVPQMVNWIAENVETPWHLLVDMESAKEGYLRFSFADPDLGVMFKMANA